MNRHYTTCQDCVNLLFDYLESTLDPETLRRLDQHFSACGPCINFLHTYRSCLSMEEHLRDQKVRIPAEMEARLKSFLKAELQH